MSSVLKRSIALCTFLVLAVISSIGAAPPGFAEGQLKIVSLKEVELANGNAPKKATAENYTEYPLIIFSQNGHKEIARVVAEKDGNYRVALPPGDYILDVQGRRRGGVRATPQSFTVTSNQTVRIDMNIDTGIR